MNVVPKKIKTWTLRTYEALRNSLGCLGFEPKISSTRWCWEVRGVVSMSCVVEQPVPLNMDHIVALWKKMLHLWTIHILYIPVYIYTGIYIYRYIYILYIYYIYTIYIYTIYIYTLYIYTIYIYYIYTRYIYIYIYTIYIYIYYTYIYTYYIYIYTIYIYTYSIYIYILYIYRVWIEPSNLGVGGHIKWGYYARTWDTVDPWGLLNGRSNPKKKDIMGI